MPSQASIFSNPNPAHSPEYLILAV